MDENHIKQLLSVAMAYDNRRPGDANIAAWMEAAHRGRWTFDAALDAIHAHYAENTDFLMPGHITTRIRAAYRQPPRLVALPPAQPASEQTRKRVLATIGDHYALPDNINETPHRPATHSPEHTTARATARAELDAIRKDPA